MLRPNPAPGEKANEVLGSYNSLFGDGERIWSLEEVASLFAISRERVRQIQERAYIKIRQRSLEDAEAEAS